MVIVFDPAKDAIDKRKHRISLERAEDFDFDSALYNVDDREDYGELRYRAIGLSTHTSTLWSSRKSTKPSEPSVCERRPNMSKKSIAKPVEKNDNPEWTQQDFARAVPIGGLPASLQSALKAHMRGPQKAPRKIPVSIRLSPDVVHSLRSSGAGWQSKVDDILRRHLLTQ